MPDYDRVDILLMGTPLEDIMQIIEVKVVASILGHTQYKWEDHNVGTYIKFFVLGQEHLVLTHLSILKTVSMDVLVQVEAQSIVRY